MKVLCIFALCVAFAAAQSGNDNPMVTGNPSGRWPNRNPGQPSWRPWLSQRPSTNPGRGGPGRPNRGNGGQRPPNAPGPRPSPFEFSPDDVPGPEALRFGGHRGPGGKRPGSHFHKNHTMFSPVFKVDNVTFQNSTSVQLKEGENIFFLMKERRPPCKQYLMLKYNSTQPNQVSLEFGELKPPSRVFSPVFKVDNVTFQNTTSVELKEGENLFLKVKGRGPHRFGAHLKHRHHGPPVGGQYMKLNYNSTQPNQVSVEYGIVKPISLGALNGNTAEADDEPEDEEY